MFSWLLGKSPDLSQFCSRCRQTPGFQTVRGGGPVTIFQGRPLLAALDQLVSPVLLDRALKWRGDSCWVGDLGPLRPIVEFCHLKGSKGAFSWGVSLDFVPHLSGADGLAWHRTYKSARADIFFGCHEVCPSPLHTVDLLHGEETARLQISRVLAFESAAMRDWYARAGNVKDLIEICRLEHERSQGGASHWPPPSMVLAFLLHHQGDLEESRRWLEVFLSTFRQFVSVGQEARLRQLLGPS